MNIQAGLNLLRRKMDDHGLTNWYCETSSQKRVLGNCNHSLKRIQACNTCCVDGKFDARYTLTEHKPVIKQAEPIFSEHKEVSDATNI